MSQVQILVGSVTGTAEGVAAVAADVLEAEGHKVTVNSFAQVEELVRDPEEILLVCTANTGSGDLPDNLLPLYAQITREYPAIAGRRYGLINLGDSSYATFGEAGQAMDAALEDLGAQRIGEPLVLDACSGEDPEERAQTWLTEYWIPLLNADKSS